MTGNPLDSMGNVHIGLDNADYARRGPDFVTAARKQGRGVCFMYHPSLVDDTDLQAIEGLFAWRAGKPRCGRAGNSHDQRPDDGKLFHVVAP